MVDYILAEKDPHGVYSFGLAWTIQTERHWPGVTFTRYRSTNALEWTHQNVVHVPTQAEYDEWIVPWWILGIPLAVIPLSWVARASQKHLLLDQRWRRIERGACPECGFNLRATPHRCPECGTESKYVIQDCD